MDDHVRQLLACLRDHVAEALTEADANVSNTPAATGRASTRLRLLAFVGRSMLQPAAVADNVVTRVALLEMLDGKFHRLGLVRDMRVQVEQRLMGMVQQVCRRRSSACGSVLTMPCAATRRNEWGGG